MKNHNGKLSGYLAMGAAFGFIIGVLIGFGVSTIFPVQQTSGGISAYVGVCAGFGILTGAALGYLAWTVRK